MLPPDKNGFTLIELLITLGLMAVISAGVVTMIGQGPRQRARDGRRQADLQQISSALELYRNSTGAYPLNLSALATSYIQVVPSDPLSTQQYSYNRLTNTTYTLCAAMEKPIQTPCSATVINCNTCTVACNCAIFNP